MCTLGNKEGLERIRTLRHVSDKHHFTMLCHNFAQLGQFVIVDNADFRLAKSLTPGPTFILKGTKEVPRRTLNPKKHTVGVRNPRSQDYSGHRGGDGGAALGLLALSFLGMRSP